MPPSISIMLSRRLAPASPASRYSGSLRSLRVSGKGAQHVGAPVKCQLAQRRSADLAGVSGHRREIQPRARCAGDDAAVHRARNIDKSA